MSVLTTYEESFKRQVVAEVLTGQISKEEARRKYNIRGHTTVLKWIRKFEKQSSQLRTMNSDAPQSEEALLKRIIELEKQVLDEKLRSEALSLMIDIAEKELAIEIRKKLDTKQSKR